MLRLLITDVILSFVHAIVSVLLISGQTRCRALGMLVRPNSNLVLGLPTRRSQLKISAISAILQFAFPLFHHTLHLPFHSAFHCINLSNMCSKQTFYCINLTNISQSVRSFGRSLSPSKV